MDHHALQHRFATLTTAHLADACIRAQVPVRCGAALLRAVVPGSRLAGRVCPARHAGSVDAFLEAFETAAPGDVLVVDNGGRLDEACAGDLMALEAQAAGLDGDGDLGAASRHSGPTDDRAARLQPGSDPRRPAPARRPPADALESAVAGDWMVNREDLVLAERIRAGASLHSQVQFSAYLAQRGKTPALSFRDHLRVVGGAMGGRSVAGPRRRSRRTLRA